MFITFEGIDGAGKSTHIDWLVEALREQGKQVIATREPGGTVLGEKLRELLLHESMTAETETLLMFAARREHIEQVITPALRKGHWVISDRFTDASFAYQGGGRGVAWDNLVFLEKWIQQGIEPDMTFVFDLDVDTANQRLMGTMNAPDRFEQEKCDFFEAVRAAYFRRIDETPSRYRLIDATKTKDEVRKQLQMIVANDCI